ncbi:hypothetical protein LWI29_036958 [Acer saccharum]|uniref:Uncharacterized protein n=1 Tax=Acer saccharum TaxID=4024 RepID=A0AA39TAE3_ACESA|nr:hypothetical protein LWI29_036958 [Acer saccharum]
MIWQGVISQPIQREKRQRHQKRLFLLLGIWFSINLLTINIYTLPFSGEMIPGTWRWSVTLELLIMQRFKQTNEVLRLQMIVVRVRQ